MEAESRPGQVVRDQMAEGDDADYVLIDTLEQGASFASLSAMPLPGAEPFTAVVTSPGTSVLMGSERCVRKLPAADLAKLRQVLVQSAKARMRRLETLAS